MLPYIIIFLIILIFAMRDMQSHSMNIDTRKSLILFLTLLLSLFVGLRDMIGGYDVYIYGEIFDITPPITSFQHFLSVASGKDPSLPQILEPGYIAIGGLIKLFTDNRYHFFLILSILSYFMIFRTFNKFMPFVFLAIFIFSCKFMLMSFVYVRQMLAMAIVWSAIPAIFKRDILRFSILIFIAFIIHNSALLFFPVYFLGLKQYSSRLISVAIILSFALGLTPFFSSVLGGVGETMNIEKAQLYANKGVGGINYFYVLESTLIGFFLYFNRNRFYKGEESTLFFNLALGYVCLTFFTLRDATGIRFVWYFLIGIIYVISAIPYLYRYQPMMRQTLLIGTVVYFSALHFRLLTVWDFGDMMPYQTYLNETKRPSIWRDREYTMKYAKPTEVLQ